MDNGDFEINGWVFGCDRPTKVVEFESGGVKWRVQDTPNPVSDGTLFGRDYKDPQTVTLKVTVTGDTPEEAMQELGRLAKAWEAPQRLTPGHVAPLRMRVHDRTMVMWGRPRDWSIPEGPLWAGKRASGELTFERSDSLFYSESRQGTLKLTLFPAEAGGIIFPVIFPWGSTPGGPRSGIVDVQGTMPTPARIYIHGPVTTPIVTGPGWKVELRGLTLKHDEQVIVDGRDRTAIKRGGGSVAQHLTRESRLTDLLMPPGRHEVRYQGTDETGTSYVHVTWQPAFSSI